MSAAQLRVGFLVSPGGFHKGIPKLVAPFREGIDFQKINVLMNKRTKPNCFKIVMSRVEKKNHKDSEKTGPGRGGENRLPGLLLPRVLSLPSLASMHSALFPVLLHLLHGFVGISRTLVSGVHIGLVNGYQSLLDIILHRTYSSADGLTAKAVRYQAEMRQAVLYVRLQDRSGPVVPVGGSVLMEKVCEFFSHLLCC